ncbi:Stress-associated endoplasmic reticulum protein [Caenorhabditis elegans]|uniref:Stress-associated endoplasmic reticulum protein n=1 Tax=Caenorhabditis elegans TaxID=6239 RepID=Q94237_CAEEL|nr:Stress-associated endoplasmic reticulum protein [Caenorhabditis elegans]CCD62870.1 Stress-associated endoplasmic reticulum protein [Caenorhabditis elegans]|eukprot:NP_508194.1 Uncharacterized protein CELE_F55A4.3 [Caenorhabditis elegans]
MADQELRRRRVGQEATEIRKRQRAERIYKIEKKAEPMSWTCYGLIALSIIGFILFLIEAFTGFKRIKSLF